MSNENITDKDHIIIGALRVIQDICKNSSCEDCVFADNGNCKLEDSPNDWEIRDNPIIKRFL